MPADPFFEITRGNCRPQKKRRSTFHRAQRKVTSHAGLETVMESVEIMIRTAVRRVLPERDQQNCRKKNPTANKTCSQKRAQHSQKSS